MKSIEPIRWKRFALRIARKADHTLKLAILRQFNHLEFLDRLLPAYLQKYSFHIEWDIDSFHIHDENEVPSINSTDPYLSRKIYYSKNQSKYPNPFSSDIAIVIQGPIVIENQTTLRVVSFYLDRYPDAVIVLSTWSNTPIQDLDPFTILSNSGKIKLVLSEDLETPGVFNVNRQIVSTLNGLNAADGKQTYAIKTRTDQILTNPRLFNSLKTLLEISSEEFDSARRIVISSLNTFAFRLYGASDMFQFGNTKDLVKFWEQPLDTRLTEDIANISPNLELEARKRVAEVYLNTNYFTLLEGQEPIYSFEESLNFLAKRFVVADADSLGHRWIKNTNLHSRWRVAQFPNKFYELSYLDWLSIINYQDNWLEYEKYIYSKDFYDDK